MSKQRNPTTASAKPPIYQIRIKGHLGAEWTEWFEGLTVYLEEGDMTLLSGPVIDQAALHGLIKKVRDLGMPLIAINCVENDPANGSKVEADAGDGSSLSFSRRGT